MPTENRSSNTVMVNVPQSLIERLEKFGEGSTQARTVRMDTLEQLYALCGQPALQPHTEPASYPPCDYCGTVPSYHPWHGSGMINGVENRHIHACDGCRWQLPSYPGQPHSDPIAWMVGTAFWWTKEEAERDAAETGLPIVGLGPMAGVAAAEQRSGDPVAWMAMTLKGSLAGTLGLARYDQRLNPDLYEGPFPVFRHADPGEVERLRGWVSAYKESRERLHEWLREEQLKNISLRAQLAEAQALLRKIGGYNWADVDPEERARTRAELRDMLSASAEPSALPDPLGCNECTHAECGRFDGPRQVECRAMADNACEGPGASS